MKLVRQSCPRRHNAVQHPANARKGRIAEQLLNNAIMDVFSSGALYCSYIRLPTNGPFVFASDPLGWVIEDDALCERFQRRVCVAKVPIPQ
jgi:hypothetical protein